MRKVLINSPIRKEFDAEMDVKEISDWSETVSDPAEKYLYAMKKGPMFLPNLYIKTTITNVNVPTATDLSIEDLS